MPAPIKLKIHIKARTQRELVELLDRVRADIAAGCTAQYATRGTLPYAEFRLRYRSLEGERDGSSV